jgi:hypothetical protein
MVYIGHIPATDDHWGSSPISIDKVASHKEASRIENRPKNNPMGYRPKTSRDYRDAKGSPLGVAGNY